MFYNSNYVAVCRAHIIESPIKFSFIQYDNLLMLDYNMSYLK